MSRPRYTYTSEQLLALQNSPLIQKPDNLPRIDQWIDSSSDPSQRRPRTQGGITAAREENEHPQKRPSLFESRQRQGHSYSAHEDVFLGPKVTFASASAARQNNKRFTTEEKANTEESKERFDRFGPKDRFRREPYNDREKDKDARDGETDSYRPRFGRQNGIMDEDESRPKRFGDFHERAKEPREGGVALDGRRPAPNRGRLDQPWHRSDTKTEDKSNPFAKEDSQELRGWRDGGDRRNDRWGTRDNTRTEKDPQWMKDSLGDDAENPSQEDFERWKEKMKAAADPKSQTLEKTPAEPEAAQPQPPPSNPPEQIIPEEGLFGIFGGGGKQDAQKAEAAPQAPKPVAKPKASRFAGMFKQEQPIDQPPTEEPSSPSQPPSKRTTEDQEGFARMMQMLRMGGSSSQGPANQLFGRPPSGEFPSGENQPRSPISQPQERVDLPSPNQVNQRTDRRPEIQSRDSQFLLKLMQQPQQTPFNEAEIYGQNFPRRDLTTSNQVMPAGGDAILRQQDSRARGPPPGLYTGEQSFPGNQGFEGQNRDTRPRHTPQMSGEDRFGGSQPQRFSPADEGRPQQPPMFNQLPPQNMASRGNMHPGQEGSGHPPGFPAPPGQGPPFPPFSGHHQMGPGQYGNGPPPPMPPPPTMRSGQMQSPHAQQPPPGFFGGPPPPPPHPPGMPGQGFPPGFGPPPPQVNNMQPPPPHGQQMRPPPGMPQGPEMYGDAARRGPGPGPNSGGPMGSQWPPQFLKDMGGGYQ